MDLSRADGVQPPVVFVVRVVGWVDQPPVGVGAGDRDFDSAERIHNAAKAVEIDHGGVINANAEVVGNGVF